MEKVYVKVKANFDTTGYMIPQSIIWSDGRVFEIERVTDFSAAEGIRADCHGECFTVLINGKERYLFFERADSLFRSRFGRWFVEKKAG